MKNMYLILSVLFLFTGCNEEEAKKQEDTSIYGTWQLTQSFVVDGARTETPDPITDI